MFEHLPGGEILRDGLRDLRAGSMSLSALLVLTAEYRLSRCGIEIPSGVVRPAIPEHEVYRLLANEHGPEAYRHYRAWIQRLVSLENALEGLTKPGAGPLAAK
jgi:hypothetical protein